MSLLNNTGTALLRLLPPELAHDLGIFTLARGAVLPQRVPHSSLLEQKLFGLTVAHPLGLAAGFDKNARALRGFASLGFSFLEAGTVTPLAQPGNPKPRLFRLKRDGALINRMGFNNEGSEIVAHRLQRWREQGERNRATPLGINLGKNKASESLAATLADYDQGLRNLAPLADYAVLNLSSPNTPGLRDMQRDEEFGALLELIATLRDQVELPPLFIKLAPDLEIQQTLGICERMIKAKLSGVILTNTTISRDGLRSPAKLTQQGGGLSGQPLRQRACEMTREVFRATRGKLAIIGSGGISDAESAIERIKAGASLLQIYSALVLRGPGVIPEIVRGLLDWVEGEGVASISELIGSGVD